MKRTGMADAIHAAGRGGRRVPDARAVRQTEPKQEGP